MKFTTVSHSSTLQPSFQTQCLIIGVSHDGSLLSDHYSLTSAVDAQITTILSRGDLKGELGKTVMIPLADDQLQRILFINCGNPNQLTAKKYHKILANTAQQLKYHHIQHALSTLHFITTPDLDLHWKTRELVLALHETFYQFDQCKSKKAAPICLEAVELISAPNDQSILEKALKEGTAIAQGIKLCKDLANMPPNICTPTYLANQAIELGKQYPALVVTCLEEAEIKKLGMGSFLSVTQGSDQPPKFVQIEYRQGTPAQAPLVLVGKGITFDSGGYNLKPPAGMAEMKYDMCGAATVMALMQIVAEMKLPLNVVALTPICENLVNGKASRPSDIVTSMAGKTIEILNTDAEGRLILCDALTYAKKFNPETVIDVATLTGAAIIALGTEVNTLFSNHAPLAAALIQAGKKANDSAWELPMTEEAHEYLKSNHADIANVKNYGDTTARCIQGACFLSYFAEDFQWAHLDVAGTAMVGGKDKHATGRPIPLLIQYLLDKVPS